MLNVKLLNEGDGQLIIKKYKLLFPYSNPDLNDPPTYWSLNSFETKKLNGSFRIDFCYKIDLNIFKDSDQSDFFKPEITRKTKAGVDLTIKPRLKSNGDKIYGTNTAVNGVYTVQNKIISEKMKQTLYFTRHVLFSIDEKNPSFSINTGQKKLPHFLLINKEQAVENLQFFIVYEHSTVTHSKGEEINFRLNLFTL